VTTVKHKQTEHHRISLSLHSLSLLIRSSSVSAITTKSSAHNSSHG